MAFIHLENGMQSIFGVNKMVDVVDKKGREFWDLQENNFIWLICTNNE